MSVREQKAERDGGHKKKSQKGTYHSVLSSPGLPHKVMKKSKEGRREKEMKKERTGRREKGRRKIAGRGQKEREGRKEKRKACGVSLTSRVTATPPSLLFHNQRVVMSR